jgi:hypothetical protein
MENELTTGWDEGRKECASVDLSGKLDGHTDSLRQPTGLLQRFTVNVIVEIGVGLLLFGLFVYFDLFTEAE